MYRRFQTALELAKKKGSSFLFLVLIEIMRSVGGRFHESTSEILDFIQLITNECDLMPTDDIGLWWKPFSYALLHPDQESLAFVVGTELEIRSEWPLKFECFVSEIESVLLAVAISMDSMERFQLLFYHIQSFGCPDYSLISSLAAFARCDNEAKLRFVLKRAVAHGFTETDMCNHITNEVLMRRDEMVLKLLLDIGVHPDLSFYEPRLLKTDSSRSLLQQAVYMRWRAGISVLIGWGADVNYCVGDLFYITSYARYSPLKILMDGTKDLHIPPGCDSSENDSLIEELLVTGGARVCEYDWKVFSRGSTDGGIYEGSDIEMDEYVIEGAKTMGDNDCDDGGTDDSNLKINDDKTSTCSPSTS
ncbi:uncharacterized protein EAF02_006565 [Botrytis sinoallii]|uniref:uncharacterized protein n=1 Tax=Botrytis sinoallii TaxID=1463999 RepID=UPI0019002679|nr:uncharacterized protein EAF02_006565 [Botrytis sinoallii]KAF7881877.1 hypothetical protein EAF02_006565 [Botrytis sinoallii]